MKYVAYNHNYKHKKTNDCVVRAIGFAIGKDWCSVFESLGKFSMKSGLTMDDKRIVKKYMQYLGYRIQPMPRRQDNTRYTVREFADELAQKNAIYVLQIAKHLTVIKNKDLYDTWDCSRKGVTGYWIIK